MSSHHRIGWPDRTERVADLARERPPADRRVRITPDDANYLRLVGHAIEEAASGMSEGTVRCRVCKQLHKGRIPKRGDGSALVPYRHKRWFSGGSGVWCEGTYLEAEIVGARADLLDPTTAERLFEIAVAVDETLRRAGLA